MFRFKTISSLLISAAAILVFFVFILHFFAPSYQFPDHKNSFSDQQGPAFPFLPQHWIKPKPKQNESNREITLPISKCPENPITIEQYRLRSVNRGVIVRFPSKDSEYYFVQFRWFYRSWIESEMYTLDRWRTDLIVLIDDSFPEKVRLLLEHLDCHFENKRKTRRQISRCILVNHKLFTQRSESDHKFYIEKYPMLGRVRAFDDNVDRLFAVYNYIIHLNNNETMYDYLMVTTMNTFLTTQFGKYVPLKCSFLIGKSPDYSTWYGKPDQIIEFLHTILSTMKKSSDVLSIEYVSAIEKLQHTFLFATNQVDIPCDSKITTYRTSIYHIKCYSHSTSLFSEKMFRENAYDGFEKEPFNIYIAREYAALMALQSKVMTLDALHKLAVNVTRREVYK
jgi:hypothetical protein